MEFTTTVRVWWLRALVVLPLAITFLVAFVIGGEVDTPTMALSMLLAALPGLILASGMEDALKIPKWGWVLLSGLVSLAQVYLTIKMLV